MCAPRCAGLQLAGMKFIDTLFMIVVCFSPSLSFFVKRWPSKGRIGKHKKSRRENQVPLSDTLPLYAKLPRRQPHLIINETIDYFIHSFILYVRVIVFWLLFFVFLFCFSIFVVELQPKKAVRPKCSLPVGLTVPVCICARLCVRRCVSACVQRAGPVIALRLHK